MFEITNSEFVTSSNGKNYPDPIFGEIAFLGRSNCGKSSLINMITRRKNLVKTGATPGMTKLANYFLINKSLYLVDLPGYGFAKMPVKEKKKLEALIYSYIDSRSTNIRAFFLLMDIRRKVAEEEKNMLKLLAKKKIPAALTLTKADKVNQSARQKQIKAVLEDLDISREGLFVTSSHTGEGRDSLLSVIESLT